MRQRESVSLLKSPGPALPSWSPLETAPKHPSSGPRIPGLQKPGNGTPDNLFPEQDFLIFFVPQTFLASSEVKNLTSE